MAKSLILILITLTLSFANPLDRYDSKSLISISRKLNGYYTGPLIATGGAIADMNRYIDKMSPKNIGTVSGQSIALIDSPTIVYTFKRVKAYSVVQDSTKFSVYYMKAKRNGERYDIIVELRGTDYYDRILRIYKEDEPHTVVLWRDTFKVRLGRDNRI